jgi:hypothetical protein
MVLLGILLASLIAARIFEFQWWWYVIIVVIWLLGAFVIIN